MKTILIAEHAASPRDFLVHSLKDDYTVVTANDGAAAVGLAVHTEPDLIFMALALPVLDGEAATRQIKAQRRLHDIPIVARCADTLGKPLDADQLYATVRKFLGGG